MRLGLLSVQQDQSQKTYLSQLCTIMQHKSDFVLSGIIDVKLHVYHPFSVSPYIKVAFIIATIFLQFVMNYFHHTFHSLISLAELCILFTWAIYSLHHGEFFPPILFFVF